MDAFTSYETGLTRLLERLGRDHPRYAEALTLQSRLSENIAQAQQYGDTETRCADRAQIVDALNQLALDTLGVSFNDLCGPAVHAGVMSPALPPFGATYNVTIQQAFGVAIGNQAQVTPLSGPPMLPTPEPSPPQTLYPVIPLGTNLPTLTPPLHLSLPPGYHYLGRLDGLTADHLYRERDGHIALCFPSLPGAPAFLIDKYAITTKQWSACLNDLVQQGRAYVDGGNAPGSIARCVDAQGRLLALDAQAQWQRTTTSHKAASPWGITYQSDTWQPIAGCEMLPATLATWWGARLYSLWVHGRLDNSTDEHAVCLPTAQQWLMAALLDPVTKRQRRYPWGETWERERVNYAGYWAGCEVRDPDEWERWQTERPGAYTSTRPLPVSVLTEGHSPIGCVQLIGNVWEWCADARPDEPAKRIIKGGACNSPQEYCVPDYSVAWRPDRANEYIGFRCAFTM